MPVTNRSELWQLSLYLTQNVHDHTSILHWVQYILQLHTVCFECYGSFHNIRKPYQYCNNFLQRLKPPLYRIKHCTSSCGHNNIWFVPFTLAVVLRTLQTTTIHTTVLHSFILFLLQGVVNNVSSYLKTSLGHWYCGLVLLSYKAGCASQTTFMVLAVNNIILV